MLADRPIDRSLSTWVSEWVESGDAEALVFDYVGFPSRELSAVAAVLEVPVFDLGHLALDALEEMLDAR